MIHQTSSVNITEPGLMKPYLEHQLVDPGTQAQTRSFKIGRAAEKYNKRILYLALRIVMAIWREEDG